MSGVNIESSGDGKRNWFNHMRTGGTEYSRTENLVPRPESIDVLAVNLIWVHAMYYWSHRDRSERMRCNKWHPKSTL